MTYSCASPKSGWAGAQSAPYHGKVELLAQEDALEAGRIATLGVLVSTERDGLRLTLKKSSLLEKPVSVLKGLLVFSPDRAFEIAAPVLAQR
ncbi:MAG: hypothetical protein EXQ59_05025 [Acidobacteria bacterium]|nr:hypothetical protein [Acidobacteriota bacterium]